MSATPPPSARRAPSPSSAPPPSSPSQLPACEPYADLSHVAAAQSRERLLSVIEELRRENDSLRTQLQRAQQRSRVDAKKRQVLLHNLGALLRTAKAELARLQAARTN